MPADAIPTLAMLFLIVGALYAAVGHAGASGYLLKRTTSAERSPRAAITRSATRRP